MLTADERAEVDVAERRANLGRCIDGRYPATCKHELLTVDQRAEVDAAERRANFERCIDGRYPASCKHGLLSSEEYGAVREAERRSTRPARAAATTLAEAVGE